jgi:hypothetical protein
MTRRKWALVYIVWLAAYAGLLCAYPDGTAAISVGMFAVGAGLLCTDFVLFIRAWLEKRRAAKAEP